MKLLLRQVTIIDPTSSYHSLIKDVFIINGRIEAIDYNFPQDDAQLIQYKNAYISKGWVDVFAHFNDPGSEYKETIETGAAAAAAGGYTNVFVLPNTQPTVSTKSQVEYVRQKAKDAILNILPIASITKNIEGKELAEMYDMQSSGAVAFSDGLHPVQTSGLMLKALQYVKAFDGTIIQLPVDRSINRHGLMNEGVVSTQMGLPGLPAIAEELMISRDIELTRYTSSRLHITGLSTSGGLQFVRRAKKAGVAVTCSVTPYHLYFCDDDMHTYDTNLKVDPPLRSRADMMALRSGIADGTIDCVASHHLPQDWDHKVCEFEYAHSGMIGLQTTFNVLCQLFPDLPVERISGLLSDGARKIFRLPPASIREGEAADLTIFSTAGSTTFTQKDNKSRSGNSPFVGVELKGRVLGIVNGDKLYLNE